MKPFTLATALRKVLLKPETFVQDDHVPEVVLECWSRQTTTGSAQLQVVFPTEGVFNVTITKARS